MMSISVAVSFFPQRFVVLLTKPIAPDAWASECAGGVRFTLVSSVSVTAGYAWNPTHKLGEGQGAFFFAMKFHDLFE
jgi:hypothetical protein